MRQKSAVWTLDFLFPRALEQFAAFILPSLPFPQPDVLDMFLQTSAATRLPMLSTAVSHYTAEERASTRTGSVLATSNVGQTPGR